jgi:hypothetical protein
MKNVLILAALCVGLFSCKKDFVCQCNTVGAATDSTQFNVEYPLNTVTKGQAKQRCADYQDKLHTSRRLDVACAVK